MAASARRRTLPLLLFATAMHNLVAADPIDGVRAWAIGPPVDVLDPQQLIVARGAHAVVSTTVSKELATSCVAAIEAIRTRLDGWLSAPLVDDAPTQVMVFAHLSEYNRFIARQLPEGIVVKGGYYDVTHHASLLAMTPGMDATHATLPLVALRHELAHQLLHQYVGPHGIPCWLDEGLACCWSYWDPGAGIDDNIRDNLMQVGQDATNGFLRTLESDIDTDRFIAPATLFTTGYNAFHSGAWAEYQRYSESWALCNFLMRTPRGRTQLHEMLATLRAGQAIDYGALSYDVAVLTTEWYQDLHRRMLPQ
jgi:hypothetical protein